MIDTSVSNRRFFRNTLSMLMLQAGNFLVPLLTLPYLSRQLELDSFGLYSFSLAVMVALGVLVEWGFPLCATAAVAANRDNSDVLAHHLASTVAAKALLATAASFLLFILCLTVPAFVNARLVLLCAFGLVIAFVFNLGWYLQGVERVSLFAVTTLASRLITVPAVYLLVQRPDQAWLAAFIQSGGALLAATLSILLVWRMGGVRSSAVTIRDMFRRLNEARHFFLAAAAINLYTASTVIIIGMVASQPAVAIFAGADRIKSAAQNILAPLSQVVYPRSVHAFNQSRDLGVALVQNAFLSFAAVGLLSSLALLIGADLLVALLLGPEFEGAVPILRILSIIPFLSAVSNALSIQAMVPLGLAGRRSQILILITLVSVPSTFAVSHLYGALGAAWVVVGCEAAGMIMFFLIVNRHFVVCNAVTTLAFVRSVRNLVSTLRREQH